MSGENNNVVLNIEEFTTFLLLYAANADLEFSSEESDMIKSRVSKSTYERVFNIFDKLSEYARLNTIMLHKELHFNTEDKKNELFKMMQVLFNIDGEYSALEKNLLIFLEKLM